MMLRFFLLFFFVAPFFLSRQRGEREYESHETRMDRYVDGSKKKFKTILPICGIYKYNVRLSQHTHRTQDQKKKEAGSTPKTCSAITTTHAQSWKRRKALRHRKLQTD